MIEATRRSIKYTFVGIAINFVLAVLKVLVGFLGHSYALIADGFESASDVFSSAIILVGLTVALKAPDKDHPYGHGKAEPLAALTVSLFLLIAAIIVVIQSIHYIVTPHNSPKPYTLIILGLVIVVKELLYRKISRIGKEIESTAVQADAWHHRSDAISSVAAFIGILIALAGGKGYEAADDWAALVAAAIIVVNAIRIFMPAFNEIMDAAPPEEINTEMRKIASSVEGVIEVEKCITRKMGLEYLVDIHVVVNAELTVREGHRIAHLVKDQILAMNAKVLDVLVHIEPDVF